ncbi:glycosyltransferase [Advenella sp. WQ 585]|uniref:Glycosyltransferase n=1 Tax=Advenella mandrilli TaxID=2800330 RepID=A0ABS1EFX6_9BURK|nr:glycosyltransferase [Advenella mandrilli]MBK1781751.1 glycosyltransferase [Advenella mandrilli]
MSLITPVFNGEAHLHRCVESIITAANGYTIELILIDDGSTDNSGAIGREYAERLEWVHYVHQENKGPSAARNVGLELARGDYIGFVDCDDCIAPTYVSELLLACRDTPDIVVYGYERKLLNEQARIFSPKPVRHEAGGHELLANVNGDHELFWFPWTKIFRSSLLQHIRFDENMKLGEDTIFNLQAVSKAQYIVRIPDVLYSYNETQGSLSSPTYKPGLLENMEHHFKGRLLVHEHSNEGLNNSVRTDITKYYLSHIVPWLLSNAMRLDKSTQLDELAKIRNSQLVKTCFNWKLKIKVSRGQTAILLLLRFRMLRLLRFLLVQSRSMS